MIKIRTDKHQRHYAVIDTDKISHISYHNSKLHNVHFDNGSHIQISGYDIDELTEILDLYVEDNTGDKLDP